MEEKSKKTKGILSVIFGLILLIMAANGVTLLFDTVISTWIISALLIITGIPSLKSKTYSIAIEWDNEEKKRMIAYSKEFISPIGTAKSIYFGETIDPKIQENALKKYGKHFDEKNEEILMLYDNTIMGSGKKGFFITNGFIYRRLDNNSNSLEQGRIPLKEITSLGISRTDRLVQHLEIDGKYMGNVGIEESDAKTIISFFRGLKDQAGKEREDLEVQEPSIGK
jgi:hypothetical protein